MSNSSTDDNSELVDMDDLNTFENALFQRTPKEPEVDKVEEVDENDDNPVADEDDQPEDQDEPEADAEELKPDAKGKRNRTQERIEKLVTEARVAEREAAALRQELERFKASKEEVKAAAPTPTAPATEAPQPNTLNDKGEPVYPLGEFDPMFIKDLSTFYAKATIEHETKVAKEAALKEAQEKEFNAQKAQLQEQWSEKLEAVQETLPDYNENIQKLAVAFQGVDPQYGDYLASTVMQCDNGPEIMYYLSQNIGEAQKIVASGPLAATLAIGRLQAKFEVDGQEEKSNKKVSQAPPPPPVASRGKGGQFQVRPDTDDLAAFERDFFK